MLNYPKLIRPMQAAAVDPALGAVNAALRAYEAAWDSHVDSWLVVRIGDPTWVFKWRLQVGRVVYFACQKRGLSTRGGAVNMARPLTQCFIFMLSMSLLWPVEGSACQSRWGSDKANAMLQT